jgi:hypothetical protein
MPPSERTFHTLGLVPAVKPNDVKVAWEVFAAIRPHQTLEGTVGICTKVFADRCDPASDVTAVGARAMIVEAALQAGALEKWRKGDGLEDRVFEVAATCAITRTADGFNLRDFDEVLGERPDEG